MTLNTDSRIRLVLLLLAQAEKEGTVGPLVPWTVVGRPADGRRTVVGGVRTVNGAEKKAFDRGGPVWPPRSNAKYNRLGGPEALHPSAKKPGGLGGGPPRQCSDPSSIVKKSSIWGSGITSRGSEAKNLVALTSPTQGRPISLNNW